MVTKLQTMKTSSDAACTEPVLSELHFQHRMVPNSNNTNLSVSYLLAREMVNMDYLLSMPLQTYVN